VNFGPGLPEPAQYWVLSGAAATAAHVHRLHLDAGAVRPVPRGGFAGDENARPATAIRARLRELRHRRVHAQPRDLARITGDPVWGDRTEELAFNSLPAALDPQGKAIHYVTSANSVDLDNAAKTMGQYNNNWAMQSYRAGVDQYRCCPHNYAWAGRTTSRRCGSPPPTAGCARHCTGRARSPPGSAAEPR